MKPFIIRSISFLGIAALVSVGIFFLVSSYKTPTIPVGVVKDAAASTTESTAAAIEKKVQNAKFNIPDKGIRIATLKLSPEQKSLLKKVGIDTQTFVLTKDMLACASDKLGEQRLASIAAGAAPSILETTRLLPCLSS